MLHLSASGQNHETEPWNIHVSWCQPDSLAFVVGFIVTYEPVREYTRVYPRVVADCEPSMPPPSN